MTTYIRIGNGSKIHREAGSLAGATFCNTRSNVRVTRVAADVAEANRSAWCVSCFHADHRDSGEWLPAEPQELPELSSPSFRPFSFRK